MKADDGRHTNKRETEAPASRSQADARSLRRSHVHLDTELLGQNSKSDEKLKQIGKPNEDLQSSGGASSIFSSRWLVDLHVLKNTGHLSSFKQIEFFSRDVRRSQSRHRVSAFK